MSSRNVMAFAVGIANANIGVDVTHSPYASGEALRHWLRGWKLMRKTLEREREETKSENKEVRND